MAFALVVPTTAMAGHDLGIYKTEKHVDITSDDQAVDLACYPGDYALDGMWRIDHADYDEDDNFITFIGRAVDVAEAFPQDTLADADNDFDGYHFLFNKNAFGRAQVKVFATCIKRKTEQSSGHQHDIVVTKKAKGDFDPAFTAQPGTKSDPAICPINSFVAQTGFKINQGSADPDPFVGHVSTSWMTLNNRGWDWVIDISQDPGSTVDFYASCVSRKLLAAGGEKHKLVYRHQGPETHSITANKVRTKRISCQSAYKAVVAGFSFFPGSMAEPNSAEFPGLFVPQLWFLGMDPQPKSRDFKFLNSDSVAHNIQLRTICLNYRTT